ncbi:hypothetical protein FQA39_LY16007 [Lamprigera yunnana]|nr:hypothetical protein FQA39_LY16007 [Lamprigera yunnana]
MDEHNVDRNKRKKGVKSVIRQCERIKRARIKGDKYVNYKENVVPKKEMGLNCNCRSKCLEKLSEGTKQEVFNKLYSFGSKNEQDAYLQSLISAVPIQRKVLKTMLPNENLTKAPISRILTTVQGIF